MAVGHQLTNGEKSYAVEPDWYTENGSVWGVLNLQRLTDAEERYNNVRFQCCDGYGVAFVGVGTKPKITPGVFPRDPSHPEHVPTTCELDDGTIAESVWGSYQTVRECLPAVAMDTWWVINSWKFTGSDGKTRTVVNPWQGNPQILARTGTNNWVPFAWESPRTQRSVYTLKDGKFEKLILTDSDITSFQCNFYNNETSNYDGVDVRTSHNDLDFDFAQSYSWPKPAFCDEDPPIYYCTIRKSIPSIIQTNAPGYSRYRLPQSFSASSKVTEKGQLTNITLQGAYEIFEGEPMTTSGDYNADSSHTLDTDGTPLIDRAEQRDRVLFQGTAPVGPAEASRLTSPCQSSQTRWYYGQNREYGQFKSVVQMGQVRAKWTVQSLPQ